jgi:hypothetical protein
MRFLAVTQPAGAYASAAFDGSRLVLSIVPPGTLKAEPV